MFFTIPALGWVISQFMRFLQINLVKRKFSLNLIGFIRGYPYENVQKENFDKSDLEFFESFFVKFDDFFNSRLRVGDFQFMRFLQINL